MFVPNNLRRSSCFEEKFIGAKEHGPGGFEELQIRLVRSRPGAPEKIEFRQWERGEEDQERVPSKHGLRFPVSIVPWVIETLSKINPAEERPGKENQNV